MTLTGDPDGTATESEQGFRSFDRPSAESGFRLVVTPTLRVLHPQRRPTPGNPGRACNSWTASAAEQYNADLAAVLGMAREPDVVAEDTAPEWTGPVQSPRPTACPQCDGTRWHRQRTLAPRVVVDTRLADAPVQVAWTPVCYRYVGCRQATQARRNLGRTITNGFAESCHPKIRAHARLSYSFWEPRPRSTEAVAPVSPAGHGPTVIEVEPRRRRRVASGLANGLARHEPPNPFRKEPPTVGGGARW